MSPFSAQLTDFLAMVRNQDFLVLDTETTGLDNHSEVVQIAIVHASGEIYLDELVRPVHGIPLAASRIHGITNQQVSDAPSWAYIVPKVHKLVEGRDVVIYNANYDMSIMNQSSRAILSQMDWRYQVNRYWCAMLMYAEFVGDWNDYRNSYRWHKLGVAIHQQRLPFDKAHTARGDAVMTLALVNKMAGI